MYGNFRTCGTRFYPVRSGAVRYKVLVMAVRNHPSCKSGLVMVQKVAGLSLVQTQVGQSLHLALLTLLHLAIRPQGYKTFSLLNSPKHDIFLALKCVKMPSVFGILTLIRNDITSLASYARQFQLGTHFT